MNIMTRNNVPAPRAGAQAFTDAVWTEVLAHLADVIGAEAQRYAALPAAKLVAAIGYLAGSEDPDRFAVSNLLTFHGATKARALFNHRPSDNHDVLRRLATIQFGTNANAEIVDYGMTLLALVSLSDHEHDAAADKAAGKYNPVTEGYWNPEELRAELNAKRAQSPELKRAFDEAVGLDAGTLSFWSY
jgi:hypothetical protein